MDKILSFIYIFSYFFQKEHFKGSSKKRAHRQKSIGEGGEGGGGNDDPLSPPAPEGLLTETKYEI